MASSNNHGLQKRLASIDGLLEAIHPYLSDADTFDILINPPKSNQAGCSVWVDTSDGGLRDTGLVLPPIQVQNLNRSIASELDRTMNKDDVPILMGELPMYGCRVTALNYPITRHGPALCLRKPSSTRKTFDDYVMSGALDGPHPETMEVEEPPAYGHRATMEYAMKVGWNILFAGAPQAGKALDVDSLILTPTGYQRMGDVRPNDLVIGKNGKPTRVTGVFPQGKKLAYRATFHDGSSVVCCAEHLWTVNPNGGRNARRGGRGDGSKRTRAYNFHDQLLTTAQIKTRLDGGSEHSVRMAIPLVDPIEFPVRELPIDPYVLGAFLGDGTLYMHSARLTSADASLIDEVRELLLKTGTDLVHSGGYDYRARATISDYQMFPRAVPRPGMNGGVFVTEVHRMPAPLIDALHTLQLLGKRSYEKHVPEIYKFAHIDARLSLLQGLLDTDGNVDKGGRVEYSTTSAQLKNDVVFLAESLGCLASFTERHTTYSYKGEKRVGRLSYRVIIKVPQGFVPFRLPRKIAAFKPRTRSGKSGGIIRRFSKIEPLDEREMVCIAVDAPDNLYVVDRCIVTHNTTLSNAAGYFTREIAPNRRLYIIEDLEELRDDSLPENVLRVQPNRELGITESHLLQVGLRVRPDGIVIAELLRPQAAYDFISAMNTGVIGSYTTIHANSAHDALTRVETLIEQVPGIDVSPSMIASAIDLVVFVTRIPGSGRRRIKEVARVNGAVARGKYDLTYVEVDPNPQLLYHSAERLIA